MSANAGPSGQIVSRGMGVNGASCRSSASRQRTAVQPAPTPGAVTKRHVWTTPSKQERSGMLRRGRVRSCVRPTLRGPMTAGPDAIRSLAPKQIYALEWRITLNGFFQAPGSTGSPSRHHRPHHPVSCGTADGGSFGFRLRHLGLLPACDRFLHAPAKPIRSAPFC